MEHAYVHGNWLKQLTVRLYISLEIEIDENRESRGIACVLSGCISPRMYCICKLHTARENKRKRNTKITNTFAYQYARLCHSLKKTTIHTQYKYKQCRHVYSLNRSRPSMRSMNASEKEIQRKPFFPSICSLLFIGFGVFVE